MGRSLAGAIEEYLKDMLLYQDFVELQRNRLAEEFCCVPSQINYVLSTRFTPAQGYVVESRRGGGGYLKIVKLSWEELSADSWEALPEKEEGVSQGEAEGILTRLKEEGCITKREQLLIRAMLDCQVLGCLGQEQDRFRARQLLSAVNALLRVDSRDLADGS